MKNTTTHPNEKLHFQIERIAFFSDAVIAIAVTLLIIEIKAPKIDPDSSLSEQLEHLAHLIPEFISFMISFWVIIAQWTKHHKMFGHVINYDKKLITLNSLFLFIIALIPFSTSYIALNNNAKLFLPYLVYGLSLFLVTFTNFLLFNHITNKKNGFYDPSFTGEQLKWQKAEYLVFPSVILLTLIIGYFNFNVALFVYALSLVGGYAYINKHKKKLGLHS